MPEASTLNALIALAPIVILIVMMTKKNAVPSYIALPIAAALVYALKLTWFDADPNLTNATVIAGLLTAFIPIFIIWGAILLFKTMEHTGAMAQIRAWLNTVSPSPVAQLMIIGWAFAFMIEGASGFGTPAALAAPILIGLGFPALRVACLALIMNSVPVTFGAVGTPTWFGMGQLDLSSAQIMEIGIKSALIHGVAALVIPLIALSFVVSWRQIRANIVFVYLSILACVVPYVLIAFVSYEFPSLLGGMIGLVLSVVLAKYGIGLARSEPTTESELETAAERPVTAPASAPTPAPVMSLGSLVKAMFPLWGTVLVLIVTRIPALQLKGLLTSSEPMFQASLGSLGNFTLSNALVAQLDSIFGTDAAWSFSTLYIPAFIPFFLVAGASLLLFRAKPETGWTAWTETYDRMKKPILALMGALVMVGLMRAGGDDAPVIIIGQFFAQSFGGSWQLVSSYLGAIGAFFSGSNTVSNLMFAGIQQSIAENAGLDVTTILAMQSVGGAMGNMVCINNIVAVCSILGVLNKEGWILIRTAPPMLLYGAIAALVGLFMA
ncbi:MAG: L-lactate permease [Alphaproteobacteria bacterium]|jgi:lactate permease|nr:L-lactate permease [Alphaproteobacteria bacterium]